MTKPKHSLYQCGNARWNGYNEIYCKAGHQLSSVRDNGTINTRLQERGKPLEMTVCQGCEDYDHMGEPIPANERGWR